MQEILESEMDEAVGARKVSGPTAGWDIGAVITHAPWSRGLESWNYGCRETDKDGLAPRFSRSAEGESSGVMAGRDIRARRFYA